MPHALIFVEVHGCMKKSQAERHGTTVKSIFALPGHYSKAIWEIAFVPSLKIWHYISVSLLPLHAAFLLALCKTGYCSDAHSFLYYSLLPDAQSLPSKPFLSLTKTSGKEACSSLRCYWHGETSDISSAIYTLTKVISQVINYRQQHAHQIFSSPAWSE